MSKRSSSWATPISPASRLHSLPRPVGCGSGAACALQGPQGSGFQRSASQRRSLDRGARDMTSDGIDCIVAAIDGAQDISDPLEGLADRVAHDAGAAFGPEVLERLAALKKENRAAFEVLRATLKSTGCRMTALDDAIAATRSYTGGGRPKQADILIQIAQSAKLFHSPDGSGFADLDINGHRETWPIRSKGFRRWITRRFFEETDSAANSEALQSALNVIEAKAHFDAP